MTLKVRYGDFTTLTRSVTVDRAIDETSELLEAARSLAAKVPIEGKRVRLLGLGGSGLVGSATPRQLALDRPERRALTAAADRIRERFGDDALRPARLVPPARGGRDEG